MHFYTLALFGNLMGMDGLVILVIGLLFFGRRLPEVGKNLAQTTREIAPLALKRWLVETFVKILTVLAVLYVASQLLDSRGG